MTINEAQDQIVEEFSEVDDWMDRYAMIIDLGNSLPPIDDKLKTPDRLIEGCQSRVWLDAEQNPGPRKAEQALRRSARRTLQCPDDRSHAPYLCPS